MKLSPAQMQQAVNAARALITEHSTPFMNYNKMISDEQLTQAIAQVFAAVEPKA